MKYFYVICPVGADKRFSAKKLILQQAAHEHGLRPFFPLERRRHFSVKRAVADMRRSSFVLADLSFERPSCYFELGMAQAIHKKVGLIATVGTRIHQAADKSTDLVLSYSNLTEYREAISQIMVRLPQKVSSLRTVRDFYSATQNTLYLTVAIDFPATFEGQVKGDAVTVLGTPSLESEPIIMTLRATLRTCLED